MSEKRRQGAILERLQVKDIGSIMIIMEIEPVQFRDGIIHNLKILY